MTPRGELLEVVDGIEIRKKVRAEDHDPLMLVQGRRGRLEAKGPVYEVGRVGQGAAYLYKVYDPPLVKEFGDRPAAEEASDALLAYIANRKNDGESARRLTVEAVRAWRKVRRMLVARGPDEPGISRSARFVERVS